MTAFSAPQLQMLSDLNDTGPTDYADFADRAGSALGWRNRERVISALIRKGLVDDDLRLTEDGIAALARSSQVEQP